MKLKPSELKKDQKIVAYSIMENREILGEVIEVGPGSAFIQFGHPSNSLPEEIEDNTLLEIYLYDPNNYEGERAELARHGNWPGLR